MGIVRDSPSKAESERRHSGERQGADASVDTQFEWKAGASTGNRDDDGDEVFEAEMTLANRHLMTYRMILGRPAMRGRFIVDPSKSYQFGE